MTKFIVAVPREDCNYMYDWIATFNTSDAAESYAIKFEDAIVIHDIQN